MSTPVFPPAPEESRSSGSPLMALLALIAIGAILFGFTALLAWALTWAGFTFWPSFAAVAVAFTVTVVGSAIGRGRR